MNLVYLRYYFDDKEDKANSNKIHKNAKGATIWRQIKFSVAEEMRSLSREDVKGKQIFQEICTSTAGSEVGLLGADFPVLMTQIYHISRKDYKR